MQIESRLRARSHSREKCSVNIKSSRELLCITTPGAPEAVCCAICSNPGSEDDLSEVIRHRNKNNDYSGRHRSQTMNSSIEDIGGGTKLKSQRMRNQSPSPDRVKNRIKLTKKETRVGREGRILNEIRNRENNNNNNSWVERLSKPIERTKKRSKSRPRDKLNAIYRNQSMGSNASGQRTEDENKMLMKQGQESKAQHKIQSKFTLH